MRLLLAVALGLLFLWLHKAQTSDDILHRNPCEASSASKIVVSFFLSPLSLYSWLASTLVRLLLSAPALLLHALHQSLLLLLAWPWCIVAFCLSLVLTCLHMTLYLLHLALVVGVVAMLTLSRHTIAASDATNENVKKLDKCNHKAGLRMFGRRATQQG